MPKSILRLAAAALAAAALLLLSLYAVLALTTGEKAQMRGLFSRTDGRPLVIAHRGGAAIGPENTLEVLRSTAAIGADVLEIDLRVSADGQFVVIHDSTVDRTTDGTGEVSAMTVAELKALDAGHDFTRDGGTTFPFRGQGVKIPTLSEVLGEFSASKLNLEAKRIDAEKAGELCGVIRGSGAPELTAVASSSGDFLDGFRRACPEVATSASFAEVAHFLTYQKLGVGRSYSPSMAALQVPQRLPLVGIVTADFIAAARERNLVVHVWTVNDEARMRELLLLGVDGIMTDRPDLLLKILSEGM